MNARRAIARQTCGQKEAKKCVRHERVRGAKAAKELPSPYTQTNTHTHTHYTHTAHTAHTAHTTRTTHTTHTTHTHTHIHTHTCSRPTGSWPRSWPHALAHVVCPAMGRLVASIARHALPPRSAVGGLESIPVATCVQRPPGFQV